MVSQRFEKNDLLENSELWQERLRKSVANYRLIGRSRYWTGCLTRMWFRSRRNVLGLVVA